jgi:hypothetical protein
MIRFVGSLDAAHCRGATSFVLKQKKQKFKTKKASQHKAKHHGPLFRQAFTRIL